MILEKQLKNKIFSVVKKKTGLHEPNFDIKDIKEVTKCIKSSFVSTYGKYVLDFENKIRKYTNSKYVIATNSGTSALHIALNVVGVKKNTNVILPTLSFVATANSVLYNGANPIFLDSSEKNFCLDENKLEKFLKNETFSKKKKRYAKYNNKLISAIIPTHVFGSCGNIEKIINLSKKYSIPVVEDCAEGLGSFYKKKHLGTFGNLGILSFNGNKIITSGSGGAILTNSKKKYLEALNLVTVAKQKHKWRFYHNKLGWNYRISSLSAALGVSQFNKIKKILNKKKRLHLKYKKIFQDNDAFKFVDYFQIENYKSNFWLNVIRIKSTKTSKKKLLNYLNQNGIQCRPVWDLLHTLPHLSKYKSYQINQSIKLFNELILLPSSPGLIK